MDQTVSDHRDRGTSGEVRPLYEADLHAWAAQQSRALREGRIADLDMPNLIDEVGGIARHEVRRLEGRLERLCHQLLLWDHGHRTKTRALTIVVQRMRVRQVLARCPSLAGDREAALDHGYDGGRYGALREDERLPEAILPDVNPYSWEDAMGRPIAYRGDGDDDIVVDPMTSRPRRSSNHDHDVHAWALRQETALTTLDADALDLPNLADEIAALGNSEYRALESALLRLLQHLLKWDHQSARRSRSWSLTIRGQRGDVLRTLRDNPSLKARQGDAFREAYRRGRAAMLLETRVSERSVPEVNPYSWDEAMTRPVVWPEP